MDAQLQGILIGAGLGFAGTLIVTQYQHYLQNKADREQRACQAQRDVLEALKVLMDMKMPFADLRDYVCANLHLIGDRDTVVAWGESVRDTEDPDKSQALYHALGNKYSDLAIDYYLRYVDPCLPIDRPSLLRRVLNRIRANRNDGSDTASMGD